MVRDPRPALGELLQVEPARFVAEQHVLRFRSLLGLTLVGKAHPYAEQGEELIPGCLSVPGQLRGFRWEQAFELEQGRAGDSRRWIRHIRHRQWKCRGRAVGLHASRR